MSNRAHKVKTEYDDKGFTMRVDYTSVTWNVTRQHEVNEILQKHCNFYSQMDDDCCGLFEAYIEDLKDAVKEMKENNIDIDNFDKDIAEAEIHGNDIIKYYIF